MSEEKQNQISIRIEPDAVCFFGECYVLSEDMKPDVKQEIITLTGSARFIAREYKEEREELGEQLQKLLKKEDEIIHLMNSKFITEEKRKQLKNRLNEIDNKIEELYQDIEELQEDYDESIEQIRYKIEELWLSETSYEKP